MTYTLLIYRIAPASVQLPEPDESRALARHRSLQVEAAAKGHLYEVARLDEPRTGRTVKCSATGHDVTDGPFIESKEWLVGFYVVDCDDESQALARAKQI